MSAIVVALAVLMAIGIGGRWLTKRLGIHMHTEREYPPSRITGLDHPVIITREASSPLGLYRVQYRAETLDEETVSAIADELLPFFVGRPEVEQRGRLHIVAEQVVSAGRFVTREQCSTRMFVRNDAGRWGPAPEAPA